MKVSHLSQFVFTNSVHPVRVCLKSSSLQLCINIWGIRLNLKEKNLHLISGSGNVPNHGSTSFSYTTIWTVISDNCRLGRENLTYTYIMHPGLRSAYLAFAEQLRVMVTQIGCVAAPRSNFLLTAPADRATILDQLSQRILIKNKIRPDFRFGFFEGGKML